MISTLLNRVTLIALAALATGACAKKDGAVTDSTGAAIDTTGTGAAATINPAWTDANIFALLDEANAADSAHGLLASPKAPAPPYATSASR